MLKYIINMTITTIIILGSIAGSTELYIFIFGSNPGALLAVMIGLLLGTYLGFKYLERYQFEDKENDN